MKKLTLQLRSKEQAVTIIERTLLELLQTLDTTQIDSGRSYIKIVLSKDQSIIIKMLNSYGSSDYIIHAYYVKMNNIPVPVFSTVINEYTRNGSILNLSHMISDISIDNNIDEIAVEYSLGEDPTLSFKKGDATNRTNDEIINYIFKYMDRYNDCIMIKLDYLINVGTPEEIASEYTMKIQYTTSYGNEYYSIFTKDTTGDTGDFVDLDKEEAAMTIDDILNIMRKIASTVIKEKHEKGRILLYTLMEESYNV